MANLAVPIAKEPLTEVVLHHPEALRRAEAANHFVRGLDFEHADISRMLMRLLERELGTVLDTAHVRFQFERELDEEPEELAPEPMEEEEEPEAEIQEQFQIAPDQDEPMGHFLDTSESENETNDERRVFERARVMTSSESSVHEFNVTTYEAIIDPYSAVRYNIPQSFNHLQLRHLVNNSSYSPDILYLRSLEGNVVSLNLTTGEIHSITDCQYTFTCGAGYLAVNCRPRTTNANEGGHNGTWLRIFREGPKLPFKVIHDAPLRQGTLLNGLLIYTHGNQTRMITSNNGSTLQMFTLPDMTELQELHAVTEAVNYNYCAVSVDRKILVAAIDDATYALLWQLDEQTGTYRQPPHKVHLFDWAQSALTCDIAPDGVHIVLGADEAAVHNLRTGLTRHFKSLHTPTLRRFYTSGHFYTAKFSPNPMVPLLVLLESMDCIHFVNTHTWREQIVRYEGEATGLAFSHDGRTVYVGTTEGLLEFRAAEFPKSLVDTCLHYIHKQRRWWIELGWDMRRLPIELREKLDAYNRYRAGAMSTDSGVRQHDE